MDAETPYAGLSPEAVLDAIDALGFRTDGTLTALNSYENRVYQVGLEEEAPIIAKFYRPNRWSNEAILEEHAFTRELVEMELPCVAPMLRGERTLFDHDGYRFALFPRQAGHPPNVEDFDVLAVLGHALGRMHAVGAVKPFEHRVAISVERLGLEAVQDLLEGGFIPDEMRPAYEAVTTQLLERIAPVMATVATVQRIHGDCHLGNLLWRYDAPNFVDFDDTAMGPAIQDLWMLLAGDRAERSGQLSELVTAYDEFASLDIRELPLIEPLRTLRIMHHAAWIARRWNDPAFPVAFPNFNTLRYWSDHVLALKEQLAALDEPPLAI